MLDSLYIFGTFPAPTAGGLERLQHVSNFCVALMLIEHVQVGCENSINNIT